MGLYKRKLSDGTKAKTWTVDFQYRGVRVNNDTGCVDRKEARKWIELKKREIEADLSRSVRAASSDMTIDQALSKYWTDRLNESGSAENAEKYIVQRLNQMLGPDKLLKELTTADVADFIRQRQATVSNSTIIRDLNVLRALHGWAREVWEVPVRPIGWKKIWPTANPKARYVPTPEEVKALLAVASPRLKRVILFAVMTGLRKFEIRKLMPDDVNLNRKSVTFVGKGKKEAELPLNSAAISALSSSLPTDSSPVFDTRNMRREWDAARKATGLQRVTFHSLRHACATWLRDKGVPIETIKETLRHSNISTTLNYARAAQKELSNAMSQLEGELLLPSPEQSNSSSSESEPKTGTDT